MAPEYQAHLRFIKTACVSRKSDTTQNIKSQKHKIGVDMFPKVWYENLQRWKTVSETEIVMEQIAIRNWWWWNNPREGFVRC